MQFETIIYEYIDDIAVIKFNRPHVLNAINKQLIDDLNQALKKAQTDIKVKVVVIKGEGKSFCSGYDISENKAKVINNEQSYQYIEDLQEISRIMLKMGKPIIAALHGYVLGAGCEWALNCDIRIASVETKFGFPENSIGVTVTNAGTKLLPLLVGLGKAKELIFTSDIIDAEKAEKWGLINKVVSEDLLDEEVNEMAKKISANSGLAMRLSKQALNQGTHQDFDQTLDREAKDAMIAFSFLKT